MTDSAEFEAFMRSYQDMVFTSAIRLLGNHAEAQDIAQEVFLKAYDRFAQIKQSPTVGGWLKTVTRNLCLNHLTRYRKRWRVFSDMRREDPEQDSPAYEEQLAAPDHRDSDERTARLVKHSGHTYIRYNAMPNKSVVRLYPAAAETQ